MKIVIVGTGYVGLGTGAVFADQGNDVIGIDIDEAKVALLQSGTPHIFEPGLAELLTRNLHAKRLRFTTDYAEPVANADLIFICVGTPAGPNGGADMHYVRAAAHSIGKHLSPGRRTIIVNKSTMPIGSGDMVEGLLSETAPPTAQFSVVSNPEFLREGSAVHDMLNPDRIVLGSNDRPAAEHVATVYHPFEAPILITDLRTAEMIKYASNAFLATKIAFINEVAAICEATGADVRQVAEGMGLDARIGHAFLEAGIGFGGSCFPKDVQALEYMAEEANRYPQLLRAVMDINRDGPRAFVRKLDRVIGGFHDKTIAVWGLAFKENTDDLRESQSLAIISDLLVRGAHVRAYDPAAMQNAKAQIASPRVTFCADAYEAATGADAVILATKWNEFKGLDLARVRAVMTTPILFDGRNLYEPADLAHLGFTYRGVGLPAPDGAISEARTEQPVESLAAGATK